MKPITWTTEQRAVKELIPYEYNPRKITPERLEKLKNSLNKFNLAEIPAINTDNVIIAGHQRVKTLLELGRGEEMIDVRVPNRTLTDKEYKEYNLISNVSVGYWDLDVLKEEFADINLLDLGIDVDNFEIPLDAQEPAKILEAEEDEDLSDKLKESFEVIVVCGNEEEQEATFEDLTKKGFTCRVLTL
jgi:hypothetical protein